MGGHASHLGSGYQIPSMPALGASSPLSGDKLQGAGARVPLGGLVILEKKETVSTSNRQSWLSLFAFRVPGNVLEPRRGRRQSASARNWKDAQGAEGTAPAHQCL